MPFELHVALRYLLARREAGVHLGHLADLDAWRGGRGQRADHRAGADDRAPGRAAQPDSGRDGPRLRVEAHRPHRFARRDRQAARRAPASSAPRRRFKAKGLVSNEKGTQFIGIKGIDPALEGEVTDLAKAMVGRDASRRSRTQQGDQPPGILVGVDLAKELALHVGDSLTVLTPEGTLSPMGWMPRARRLRVAGHLSPRPL